MASFWGWPPTSTREAALPRNPPGRLELVLVLEVGAARPCRRACRRCARRSGRARGPPRSPTVGLVVGERPLHLEVGAAQAQRLLHLIALVGLAAVGVVDLAVDRHPLVQPRGVEHRLEDLLARRVDVDRCGDERHLAATSSVISQSRSARSTAASNECNRIPNAPGGRVVARQQVVLEPLHQRADQRRVLAGDRRGDLRGDRRQGQAQAQLGAADEHRRRRSGRSAARRSRCPGRRCPTSGRSARQARSRRRRGRRARRGRRSGGCGCARQAGRASTGSRSISRTRKRKERERAPITIEARSAIDSGAAPSSASSTASREARWRDAAPSRGTRPPR